MKIQGISFASCVTNGFNVRYKTTIESMFLRSFGTFSLILRGFNAGTRSNMRVYLSRLQRSEISSISIASWQTHGIDAIFVREFLSYVFLLSVFFTFFPH